MDEPTSSLTPAETEQLFQVVRDLKADGVSIIYISHRLSEVEILADRVVVLRDGKNAGMLQRTELDHNEMVRQMRSAAGGGRPLGRVPQRFLLLFAALVIVNPIGLLLTWSAGWLNRQTKLVLTAVSALWYLGVAGLGFALLHR